MSVAYAKLTIQMRLTGKPTSVMPVYMALGTSRSINIVPDLWQAADLFWPQLTKHAKDVIHRFLEVVWQRKNMTSTPIWHAREKVFPQFGPLISYLLTVDYAYAGLVSPPSMAELANISEAYQCQWCTWAAASWITRHGIWLYMSTIRYRRRLRISIISGFFP